MFGRVRGRVLTEALILTDAVTRWLRLVRMLGEDIEIADGVVRIRNLNRTLGDSLELTDEAIRALFLDTLQTTNFRLNMGDDPFVFSMGRAPVH